MTVVVRHAGSVAAGNWTDFTVERLAVDDGSMAHVHLAMALDENGYLSNFGFAIPADATITGFTISGSWVRGGGEDAVHNGISLAVEIGPAYNGNFLTAYGEGATEDTEISESAASIMPSVAWLNSAGLMVTATALRDIQSAGIVYLNYVALTVEYDEYVPPGPPEPGTVEPSVATAGVYDITATTATGGGNVTADGGGDVDLRGVVWSTSPNPKLGRPFGHPGWETPDPHPGGGELFAGEGTGDFADIITGLAPATRYYVAAFAHNAAGYTFGADVTFVTPPAVPTVWTSNVSNVTSTTATCGGQIPASGGAAITAYGLCWSTSPLPRGASWYTYGWLGAFDGPLTGLTPATRYYVCAYAENAGGVAFGADVTFVTHGPPTVATAGVYDITATAASGGGDVISDGGEAVLARGVCWSVEANPTTAVNLIPAMTSATAPSGVASASSEFGPLRPPWKAFDHVNPTDAGGNTGWMPTTGTTGWLQYQFTAAHVVRRYAVTTRNEGTNSYSPKTWTFKGSTDGTTWVTLDTQTNITDWAASANVRKVFDFANSTSYAYYRLDITASNDARYVGVGELEMMEAADDTFDGSGLGTFVSHMTGLTVGVTYNVRAYAVNAVGIAYGAAVTFTATADAPPVEPPLGPPRDPSKNLLFDGTLELKVGTLDVAASATQVKYSNSNPGGFGNLSFRLPADAPWGAFDAHVVKGAAVTMNHGLVGFAATLFEGEVTSDVSHATIAGGKGYYDVTCAGLWWAAGQRKDFSMVVGDDDYGQWYAMESNAKAFNVSTDGCLDIRLEAGQSAAAGDSASLYYWLGKGMGDPSAVIDFLFGMVTCNVTGTEWVATVQSAPTPWGPWTDCLYLSNGWIAPGLAQCVSILGDNPQALKLQLSTTSAVDALATDRFIRQDNVSVSSGVSANAISAVSAANPTVVTAAGAHGLKTGDRVFITQSSVSTPTISGWRTVTVTDGAHFTVPVAVTTAGGAGTFYKATRIDQALVEIAVTTGLATRASLQHGGIGNLNWGLNVRPHASRAGSIDLLSATNVAPFDYGFWDNKTFYCQDRPLAIRALHDYLIDSSLPGIDFDVRRATEDSPTTVKVLYKFRAEDGVASPYPDGTALAVYRTAPDVAFSATGGDKTTDGLYTVHKFTTSGSLVCTGDPSLAEVLVGGGGASGGMRVGGGGGGGGVLSGTETLTGTMNVVVGAGGDPRTSVTNTPQAGDDGDSSSFGARTALGGGGGGAYATPANGRNGGCGGGAGGYTAGTGGIGSQGGNGGVGSAGGAGGGGGVGAGGGVNGGGQSGSGATGGTGGNPYTSDIVKRGTNVVYGAGGGGSADTTAGMGSAGCSGAGSKGTDTPAGSGTANTGGGGGGGRNAADASGKVSGAGGSGIVVVRYLTGGSYSTPEWSDASPVLDVWNEWADLSLTTAQAGDLGDQILAWLSANAYQGGGSIAPATVPLRAEGTKPTAYIRGGDYIEDSNLDTGPLMITGFSMDADRGVATIGIGENRRAFVERLTPDKA